MKKPNKFLSASETLDLLNKQWATKQDIQYLANVGDTKGGEITKELKKIVEDKGYRLPHGLFPMAIVKEYFKIDINYLKKIERG